jgi:hypothetical protein
VNGYKAFNPNWTCRDYQYEVGKTYTHDGKVDLCHQGFHFCENPMDVLSYYPPTGKFAEVEADGVTDQRDSDSKRVSKTLTIKAELSLRSLMDAGVKFILSKVDFTNAPATNTGYQSAATNTGEKSAATNTGYQSAATNTGEKSAATNTGEKSAATNTGEKSAATNTGNYSAATNTGNQSAATNTGNHSAATNTGVEGVAMSIGIEGKAKGAKGCWIVLAEWKFQNGDWHRVSVRSFKVDGKKVKADTFYSLVNGKLKKVS